MSLTKMKSQLGSGLIEVLVSMLIVSIGSLSLINMQVAGKKVSYDAIQRSIATALAHDIIERMRNNPNVLSSYVASNMGNGSRGSSPSATCFNANCTEAELATRDLWEWEQQLDGASEEQTIAGSQVKVGGLVSPRACITHNAGVVTVAIAWKGFQSTSNPTSNTCGEGLSLYGSSDAQRQVIFITTYIEDV